MHPAPASDETLKAEEAKGRDSPRHLSAGPRAEPGPVPLPFVALPAPKPMPHANFISLEVPILGTPT